MYSKAHLLCKFGSLPVHVHTHVAGRLKGSLNLSPFSVVVVALSIKERVRTAEQSASRPIAKMAAVLMRFTEF